MMKVVSLVLAALSASLILSRMLCEISPLPGICFWLVFAALKVLDRSSGVRDYQRPAVPTTSSLSFGLKSTIWVLG